MSAPALSRFQNGISQVLGDNLETFNQTCDVVADLRGFIGTVGIMVYLRGYTAINDGGQGEFYWNVAGTGPDDAGVTAVVPNGAAAGCWSRSSMTSQQLLGTKTNDNAVVGYVGEFKNSNQSTPQPLLTGVTINVTNLQLTPGDWDVWGNTFSQPASGTTTVACTAGVSTTSINFNLGPTLGSVSTWNGSIVSNTFALSLAPIRMSIASNTPVYLIYNSAFSGSTSSVQGFISARRMR